METMVLHRERTPVRDADGRITVVYESEWSEPQDVHAKHSAAIEAVARQRDSDHQSQLAFSNADRDRLAADLTREHARVLELEQLIAAETAAHKDELGVIRTALAASLQAQIERDEALAAQAQDPNSDLGHALAAIAAARDAAPGAEPLIALPAHLVDLPALRALERELRALDPALTEPVCWILPSVSA